MEKKIEEIRKACISRNPSILDLEFGCEVTIKKAGLCIVTNKPILNEASFFARMKLGAEGNTPFATYTDDITSIIGRPIRLSDVLLALKYNIFHIQKYPNYARLSYTTKTHVGGFDWNLAQDDLTKQSPETLNFIFEVIK